MDYELLLERHDKQMRFWRGLFFLFLLAGLMTWAFTKLAVYAAKATTYEPRVSRDGEDFGVFHLDSYGKQLVVTHLAYAHDHNHLYSAAVPNAPLRLESGRFRISGKGLIWKDSMGEPAKPPAESDQVFVVYILAERSREYEQWRESMK
jgi:hypothetical protein